MKNFELKSQAVFLLVILVGLSALADRINVVRNATTRRNVIQHGNSSQLPIRYLWNTPYCYDKFSAADKTKLLKLIEPQTIAEINTAQQEDMTEALLNSTPRLQNFDLYYEDSAGDLKSFVETTWASCVQEDDDK